MTRVSASAATLAWTGVGSDRAECRAAGGRTVSAAARTWRHGLKTARLESLTPDTRYACRLLGSEGRGRRRLRFRTAPAGDGPFTFAVVGDTGHGGRVATALARRIRAARPAFLVHLGDFAYGWGTAAEFDEKFFPPFQRTLARVPLFPTPGNHDLHRLSIYDALFAPALYGSGSTAPRYSFTWGSAHFVSLASPAAAAGAPGLAEDLAQAQSRRWRIVFLHEPLYTAGAKWTEAGLRRTLAPVLEVGRVHLVLAGHEHFYERSEPVCQHVPGAGVLHVTSGGGSRRLDPVRPHPNFPRAVSAAHYVRVRVHPDRLDLRAIALDGRTLDRVRWTPEAARACRSAGWPRPKGRR